MRTGGRALVETTFSLDIRPLVRAGAIRDDVHADGKMRFGPDDDRGLRLGRQPSKRKEHPERGTVGSEQPKNRKPNKHVVSGHNRCC